MKVKVTLLATCFDKKLNINNKQSKNFIIVNEDNTLPSRYLLSDSPNECLKKICEKFLSYSIDWLDFSIIDAKRNDGDEIEIVYSTDFPYCENFYRHGKTLHVYDDDLGKILGEKYIEGITRATRRRFVL